MYGELSIIDGKYHFRSNLQPRPDYAELRLVCPVDSKHSMYTDLPHPVVLIHELSHYADFSRFFLRDRFCTSRSMFKRMHLCNFESYVT